MVLHFVHSPIFKFHLGDYDDCKDANIIVITAGPSIRHKHKGDGSGHRFSYARMRLACLYGHDILDGQYP